MALRNGTALGAFGLGFPADAEVRSVAAPSWAQPSFAIPLVSFGPHSNALYVQVVDVHDRIATVSPFDVPDDALLPLKQPIGGLRVEGESIHAFVDPDGAAIAGTKAEMAPVVLAWLPKITWPLSRLALADFAGDERAVMEAADATLKAKAERQGRHAASVWFANAVVFRRIQRGVLQTATTRGGLGELEAALDQVTMQVTSSDLVAHLPPVLMELLDSEKIRSAPALAMASKLSMLVTPSGLSLLPTEAQPSVRRRGPNPRRPVSAVQDGRSKTSSILAAESASQSVRRSAATRLTARMNVPMERQRGSLYEAADASFRAVISTSRRYDRPYQNYWYGFYDTQRAYLDGRPSNYLVLCAVDSGRAWAVPASVLDPLLDGMSGTTRPNGQAYRHIITKLVGDQCVLIAGGQSLDLSEYEI